MTANEQQRSFRLENPVHISSWSHSSHLNTSHQAKPSQTRPKWTRLGQIQSDQTRPNRIRPERTRQSQIKASRTRPDQTSPDLNRPDQVRPDQSRCGPPDSDSRHSTAPDHRRADGRKLNKRQEEKAALLQTSFVACCSLEGFGSRRPPCLLVVQRYGGG